MTDSMYNECEDLAEVDRLRAENADLRQQLAAAQAGEQELWEMVRDMLPVDQWVAWEEPGEYLCEWCSATKTEGHGENCPWRVIVAQPDHAALDVALAAARREGAEAVLDREAIAAVQHEIWCHWMEYLFAVSTEDHYGYFIIGSLHADRWQRQMGTPYIDLPEDEKQSDRDQADRVIAAIRAVLLEEEASDE